MGVIQQAQAGLFGLAKNDFIKGLIVAVFSAVLTAITAIVQNGGLPTGNDWHYIGTIALTALLAYLGKNLVTNNQGQIAKADAAVGPDGKPLPPVTGSIATKPAPPQA